MKIIKFNIDILMQVKIYTISFEQTKNGLTF